MQGSEHDHSRKGGGGRKPCFDADALDTARRLMKDPDRTMGEIAERMKVNRATLYRELEHKAKVPKMMA